MQILETRAAPVPQGQEGQRVQILLSTHSPQLAASADLDSMVMIIGHKAFPLGKSHTKLKDDDYAFLRRFLDATKANLFFARGLIIVEGDADNILLPSIARKIGKPFGKFGVSIVNVGHRGLFRYSRILQRADDTRMPVRVALLPDRDIPPEAAKGLVGDRLTEGEWGAAKINAHMQALAAHDGGAVKVFPSEQWTLEFDLARIRAFAVFVHQAVQIAKGRADKTDAQVSAEAQAEVAGWQADNTKSADDIAVLIFEPLYKKQVSKTMVAEQLAAIVDASPDSPADFRVKLPTYIVNAIEHVTGSDGAEAPVEEPPAPNAGVSGQ